MINDQPMSLKDVRMYFKLDAISAFDDQISVGILEFGMKGFLRGSHLDSSVRLMLRDEKRDVMTRAVLRY
jgi:hypothetical protein